MKSGKVSIIKNLVIDIIQQNNSKSINKYHINN